MIAPGRLAFLLLILLGVSSCGGGAKDTITLSGMCGYFDTMLRTFQGNDAGAKDHAIRDFLAAGISYSVREKVPGIKAEVYALARALDSGDTNARDEQITNLIQFCQPYYDKQQQGPPGY